MILYETNIDIERKEKEIGKDVLEKRSHRFAYGAGLQTVGSLVGTLIGAGLGTVAGSIYTAADDELDPTEKAMITTATTAGATGLGSVVGGAIGGYKAAKKLGYGTLGKIAGAITPLTFLFKPKLLKQAERKK